MRLNRDGELQNLTEGFASACDPAVDFDGNTIYFTGKRHPGDNWLLFKMNADGSEKEMIPTGIAHSVSPLRVGSLFHLNDEHPAPRLVFVGADDGWLETIEHDSSALYSCWMDGSGVQRITHNTLADFDPTVLPNGRVVYSSVQAVGNKLPNWKLMAVNIDGADAMLYFGQDEPFFRMLQPAASPDGRVYFIEDGRLSFVEQWRPLHTYKNLASGWFLYPCPIDDESIVISKKEGDKDIYALVRLSAQSGAVLETVLQDSEYHCVDAQVLAPNERVDGRSSVVDVRKESGVLYCLNVYESQHGLVRDLSPGGIKAVRVIEGRYGNHSPGGKTLGEALVEEDGSFYLKVPADTPLSLQLLDESGEALRTQCGAMWVRPGERRGCIGCHEDPELTPPNRLAQAVVKPAFDFTSTAPKPWLDFVSDIAPMLASTCVQCHDSTHRLDFSCDSTNNREVKAIYDKLTHAESLSLDPTSSTVGLLYIQAGSILLSPIVREMRDKPHSLDADVIQTFIDWINQGAPYSIQTGEQQ